MTSRELVVPQWGKTVVPGRSRTNPTWDVVPQSCDTELVDDDDELLVHNDDGFDFNAPQMLGTSSHFRLLHRVPSHKDPYSVHEGASSARICILGMKESFGT